MRLARCFNRSAVLWAGLAAWGFVDRADAAVDLLSRAVGIQVLGVGVVICAVFAGYYRCSPDKAGGKLAGLHFASLTTGLALVAIGTFLPGAPDEHSALTVEIGAAVSCVAAALFVLVELFGHREGRFAGRAWRNAGFAGAAPAGTTWFAVGEHGQHWRVGKRHG